MTKVRKALIKDFLSTSAAGFCSLALCLSARGDDSATSAAFHSAQDILDCVLKRHPDIQRSNADISVVKASEISARQIPNPGFNSRTLLATSSSDNDILSEINIAQPIELGGKRDSRIAKALADQELSFSAVNAVKEEVVIQTVLALNRLRQLRLEMDELEETLSIYERIREQFKNRSILSPEQRASLSVFRTAAQATALHKITLMDEEGRLKVFLEKATGRGIEITQEILPKPITHWPNFPSEPKNAEFGGAKMKRAVAELSTAAAAYRLAKSEAWPNVELGPSIEPDSVGGKVSTSFGFNMAVPLPLYHQNQGQVEEALRAQKRAQLNVELTQSELEKERSSLVERYDQNLKAVGKAKLVWDAEEERGEKDLESLFQNGVVPASLMIEANRQSFDLLQSLNAAELRAIEELWRLYALEGWIFDEKI